MKPKTLVVLMISFVVLFCYPLTTSADGPSSATASIDPTWSMAGANPERTSWTPEEVRGDLKPLWYKPFEPYISQKVQIIAANDTLYISTARGLYALDAETGAEKWVYPTEFPLGHSPTIANGVAYVGGFDRKLHAIDALTGTGLWTFEAGAGFHTNPLVIEGKVYAGNRDGHFYAIQAEGPQAGQLAWKYQTGGPVLFSAGYKDGVVFFASNDGHAYALNAQTGVLVWKSEKLPAESFHSWWSVVYRDRVIFVGSNRYRFGGFGPGWGSFHGIEMGDVFPNHEADDRGTLVGSLGNEPGDWVTGTQTIDMSQPNVTPNGSTKAVTEYFEEKPWRRTYFVLDRATGQEITYDFDNDGKPEYAPILWFGSHSGNRYPPIVGGDGVVYQSNAFYSDTWIAGGHISGWKMDTPFVSVPTGGWNAVDEPQAYAAGGNFIYWNRCCDRVSESIDLTLSGNDENYFAYNNGHGNSLFEMIPGYNIMVHNPDTGIYVTSPYASFGASGVYGWHADTNPPIPYKGKLYMHRSNALIAFSAQVGTPVALPQAKIMNAPDAGMATLGSGYVKAQLEQEIQKMLVAGHLRPGYGNHGIFSLRGRADCGDDLVDYWHNSAETIYTLTQAWPYVSSGLQQQLETYLQVEMTTYPPYEYNHIGWRDGAAREIFDLPLDVEADLVNHEPGKENYTFRNKGGWGRNPYLFYALWKYAEVFGNAQTIFDSSQNVFWQEFNRQPSDELLLKMPHVHNAYIAGYLGYLELEKLAGQPESANVGNELDRLMQLRAARFTKDLSYRVHGRDNPKEAYCRTLNVANNFMFLVPELGQYLRQHALSKVQEALAEYYDLAPYWFVSLAEEGFAENAFNPLYDAHSLFMAKALILEESGSELEKYLDVPAFAKGDLFYIQKLIAILNNNDSFMLSVNPMVHRVESGGSGTYTIQVQHTAGFTPTVTLTASNPFPDLNIHLTPTAIAPPGGLAALTLTDTHDASFSSPIRYTVPLIADDGNITETINVDLFVNGRKVYLPVIHREN